MNEQRNVNVNVYNKFGASGRGEGMECGLIE